MRAAKTSMMMRKTSTMKKAAMRPRQRKQRRYLLAELPRVISLPGSVVDVVVAAGVLVAVVLHLRVAIAKLL